MARNNIRKADVFYYDRRAGMLQETDTGYTFTYDPAYLKNKGLSISLSLPLQVKPFHSSELFPFFVGLNAEGWYRDIVCATQKIDRTDEFGLLLITGKNTIGAVSVCESGAL